MLTARTRGMLISRSFGHTSSSKIVVTIEAKADESFGQTVADAISDVLKRGIANPKSRGVRRVEELVRALLLPRVKDLVHVRDLAIADRDGCDFAIHGSRARGESLLEEPPEFRRAGARPCLIRRGKVQSVSSDYKKGHLVLAQSAAGTELLLAALKKGWSMRRLLFLSITFLGVLIPLTAAAQDEQVIPSDRVTTFVYIRSAPDADSMESGRLRPGESAELIRSVPRWYEVRLSSGVTGFVSKSWTKVTHALAPRQEDELRIHHLDIGTGACAIVECPGANASPMIVDCGSIGRTGDDLTGDDAATYIQKILSNHTARPNVVLSHGDRDHYSLIPTVLSGTQVGNIWLGGKTAEYNSDGFPAWLTAQRSGGANVVDETKLPPNWHNDAEPIGAPLSCGTASVFVLTVNTGAEKNSHSLVLLLEHHEFSAIFSGDAEGTTEQQASDNFEQNVKVTVMTGSHHGARTKGSNGVNWASNTAPDVMVYSAGEKFSHPTCAAVQQYKTVTQTTEHPARCGLGRDPVTKQEKYQIYRTRRAEYMTKAVGAIIITSNGHSPLTLHCSKSNECGVKIPH